MVLLANYLACVAAFQLLNYETKPLHLDELIGWLFGAFVPDATLCHFYALSLVLTQALGLNLLFHYAFSIIKLHRDRRWYLSHNDMVNAHEALGQMWMNLLFLLIVAIPLALIIFWDVYLFRYRGVVNMLGLEDGVQAAITVKNWDLQLKEHAHLFGWFLTHIGAWGYIAATALSCLLFENFLMKTQDNWIRWVETVRGLFQSETAVLSQPAYANGYAKGPAITGRGAAQPQPELTTGPASPPPQTPVSPRPTSGGQTSEPHSEPPVRPQQPEVAGETVDRPVIGGQPGEMVSLAAALQNQQRFYVDPATHQVWDRQAYEQLFGPREAA